MFFRGGWNNRVGMVEQQTGIVSRIFVQEVIMNRKQIVIVISGLVVLALIVWHDLPIDFPGLIVKVVMLFLKLFVVIALTIVACVFTGGKKKLP